jgi:hypothetical protein
MKLYPLKQFNPHKKSLKRDLVFTFLYAMMRIKIISFKQFINLQLKCKLFRHTPVNYDD